MPRVYPLLVLAPVDGMIAYCVAQIAIARTIRRPYFSLGLGCVLGLVVTLWNSLAALARMQVDAGDGFGFLTLNSLTYLALAFGYFNFVNLNIASLRIRILEELLASDGRMSADSLLASYNTDKMIVARLDRLVSGGHLVKKDGRFYSGKLTFLLLARFFDFMRPVILGANSQVVYRRPAQRTHAGKDP